jgi:hypothetical protein
MLRRTPLALLLLAGSVFPLSCSETPTDSDTDTGVGGTGVGTGGGLSVDGSTGGQGQGGEGATGNPAACGEFQGLEQCGLDQLSAETTPVNVLLVLDKSGSMDKAPDNGSSTTLWEAVNTALESSLADASPAVSFGLQLFPGRTVIPDCDADDCCSISGTEVDVEVGPGDEPRADILDLLGRTKPGGGTPTAEALARAHNYFTVGPGAALDGAKFVLLATDGGPNCNGDNSCDAASCTLNIDGNCNVDPTNCCATTPTGCLDDDNVLAQIEQLYQAGVDTFVVGLAGTEEYAEQLDAFAQAGGRAREGTAESYYKVAASGSAAGLTDVLNDITRQLVQECDVELKPGELDLNELNVAVDCAVVPYSVPEEAGQGGAGGEGSQDPYAGPSFWWIDGIEVGEIPTVHLGGEICGIIKAQGVERIDILRGCPTVK